jgi:serine/threonine protein kinase
MTGSLRYMAPEVACGERYNEGCDVYSFSVLLWQLITLEKPYAFFGDEQGFVREVFERGYRPPIKEKWSPGLKTVLDAGWHQNKQKRADIKFVKGFLKQELCCLNGTNEKTGLKHRRSTAIYESELAVIAGHKSWATL